MTVKKLTQEQKHFIVLHRFRVKIREKNPHQSLRRQKLAETCFCYSGFNHFNCSLKHFWQQHAGPDFNVTISSTTLLVTC